MVEKESKQSSIMLGIGVILFLVGILFPNIVEGWSRYLVENIHSSILEKDSGKLVITAIVYTAKYCSNFFMIYFGAKLMVDQLLAQYKNYQAYAFAAFILLTVLSYNYLHQETFSIIGQFVTLSFLLFIENYLPKQKNVYLMYSVILVFVLMAMAWLQLIPAFTKLGLGTNDVASSLKIADHYLTNNYLLNTLASILFAVFVIIPIILTILLHLVNKQLITMKKVQENELELEAARLALIESKAYEEVNSLVHDLKTPLSTMEGLSSLINMRVQQASDSPIVPYLDRMGDSIQKMNDMISEILYEEVKQPIPVKELVEYVTSHLILAEHHIELVVNIEAGIPTMYVNKIRFSRALSNILENAIASLAGNAGIIQVDVKRKGNYIHFQILDNGPGISAYHIGDIWEDGFSTKNSSGIGLSFVKTVVENHQGTIHLTSEPGSYTEVNITIPIYKEGEKEDEYHHINSG